MTPRAHSCPSSKVGCAPRPSRSRGSTTAGMGCHRVDVAPPNRASSRVADRTPAPTPTPTLLWVQGIFSNTPPKQERGLLPRKYENRNWIFRTVLCDKRGLFRRVALLPGHGCQELVELEHSVIVFVGDSHEFGNSGVGYADALRTQSVAKLRDFDFTIATGVDVVE